MDEKVQQLQAMIDSSDRIVFFGGAGVSTASGIPDFRSSEGLYMQESGYSVPAEEIISDRFFANHPKEFFDFYFKNLVFEGAQPNYAHTYIADLEKRGKSVAVVTQNIDGLHEKAGSQEVYKLHGSTLDNYCLDCQQYYGYSDLQLDQEGIPRCPKDGAVVRPDIVLYGEQLDLSTLQAAIYQISQADLLVILGTSLVVYPAAGLVDYFQGYKLAVVNKTTIHPRRTDGLIIQEDINKVFKQLT